MLDKKTAGKILFEIKKANRILLPLHVSPDGDAVGSVLATDLFLRTLGKKTKIISYSKIPRCFAALPGMADVEIANFSKINLSEFDLFIVLDIAAQTMITRSEFPRKFPRNFKSISIDHHVTNTMFADINLLEEKTSSVCELLYDLFKFWKVEVDKQTADLLFLGIFTDSGCFQYPSTSSKTLRIAADLIEIGADLNQTVLSQFRSYGFKTIKYWGKVLENMQIDTGGKFVWSKVSREELKQLEILPEEIEGAASLFCPVTVGTEFGIILDECEGFIKGSLRSRQGFDVSQIAAELGGGGHRLAAGFTLKMPLKEAEEKVLETARKLLISK